jgi:squalene-hopene/tetraprenyl-beta-curcumene cyclase
MNPSKYKISSSLTSLHAEVIEPVPFPARKSGAKVHRLPPSIWKKMVAEGKSPLDKAIERTRDFFFREQLPDDSGGVLVALVQRAGRPVHHH